MLIFQKITRRQYDLLTSGYKGELFYINKENKWIIRKGYFKDLSIDLVFTTALNLDREEQFWEQLQDLYDEANWIDKMNIFCICKELKELKQSRKK